MRNEKNTEHTVACGTWTRIGFNAHKERNGILMPVALAVGSHLSE